MENSKIRKMLEMLHRSNSPETRSFAKKKLRDAGLSISDLYQQMEMDDPYVEVHRAEGLAPIQVPDHSHPFGEIILCLSNSSTELRIGQRLFRLQRGDIAIIPSNISHSLSAGRDCAQTYSGIVLWVSDAYFHILMSLFSYPPPADPGAPSGGVLRTAGTVWEHLSDLFRWLVSESETRSPGWEAAISGTLTLLMAHLGRAAVDLGLTPRSGEKPELLDAILSYVDARLSHKITLEDTANRFWVSQSTITHLFREKMGISFYRYVTQRRLAEAKNLILEDMPLEQVASKVGFGDYSAFYRAFKSEFGISPREFRKSGMNLP